MMQEIGISVIMPSYLGDYPGSRKEADTKFIRAVKSFQEQTLVNKQLVIVSDGCEITNRIYRERFQYDLNITLVMCEKSNSVWPGTLREVGRSIAKWDWIHYLDTDDYDLPMHLQILANHIQNRVDETLFLSMKYMMPLPEEPNDLYLKYIRLEKEEYLKQRELAIENPIIGKLGKAVTPGHIGTWQILHNRDVPHRWRDSHEMGEDKDFIQRMKTTEKWKEIEDGLHVVCHNTHSLDRKIIWDI